MKSSTGTAGGFYREDAARLVEAAARVSLPSAPANIDPTAPVSRSYVPPVLLEDSSRPPLAPEPATNQNDDAPADLRPGDDDEDAQPTRSVGRTLAQIVLLPLYIAIAVASAGIVVLFVMSLLGR